MGRKPWGEDWGPRGGWVVDVERMEEGTWLPTPLRFGETVTTDADVLVIGHGHVAGADPRKPRDPGHRAHQKPAEPALVEIAARSAINASTSTSLFANELAAGPAPPQEGGWRYALDRETSPILAACGPTASMTREAHAATSREEHNVPLIRSIPPPPSPPPSTTSTAPAFASPDRTAPPRFAVERPTRRRWPYRGSEPEYREREPWRKPDRPRAAKDAGRARSDGAGEVRSGRLERRGAEVVERAQESGMERARRGERAESHGRGDRRDSSDDVHDSTLSSLGGGDSSTPRMEAAKGSFVSQDANGGGKPSRGSRGGDEVRSAARVATPPLTDRTHQAVAALQHSVSAALRGSNLPAPPKLRVAAVGESPGSGGTTGGCDVGLRVDEELRAVDLPYVPSDMTEAELVYVLKPFCTPKLVALREADEGHVRWHVGGMSRVPAAETHGRPTLLRDGFPLPFSLSQLWKGGTVWVPPSDATRMEKAKDLHPLLWGITRVAEGRDARAVANRPDEGLMGTDLKDLPRLWAMRVSKGGVTSHQTKWTQQALNMAGFYLALARDSDISAFEKDDLLSEMVAYVESFHAHRGSNGGSANGTERGEAEVERGQMDRGEGAGRGRGWRDRDEGGMRERGRGPGGESGMRGSGGRRAGGERGMKG